MSNQNYKNIVIVSGNSNPELAQQIGDFLGIPIAPITIERFPDGEVKIKIDDPSLIRHKHIFIVQSTCKPVNENMLEVGLLAGWLKRNSAQEITLILPYYGYSRHKKGRHMSAEAARILQSMAVDRFVTLDIHAQAILGYYDPRVMFENLEASIVPLNYFLNQYEGKRQDYVIISPDADGVSRAKTFCDTFNQKCGASCQMGILLKYDQGHEGEGEESFELIGDVKDKDIIIIDDLVDTAATLCKNVKILKQYGARKIYAYATHCLFTQDAIKKIEQSDIERVITTDTIPAQQEEKNSKKIIRLTIAPLLAEAMRRIEHRMSLETLTGSTYNRRSQHIKNKEYTR